MLGAIALHRLLVNTSGKQIHHDDRIVYGTLAFVPAERGGALPTSVSRELLRILDNHPITEDTVIEWFTKTFP